jgi:8-oxo-dGTP pyrophosphatase MutT (NUDIX family)
MRLADIDTQLAAHRPPPPPNRPGLRRAAVAIILRERPSNPITEILFIRRAEKSGDPWSGHMAFPGGHADANDASLLDTACRETREEIGLDLLGTGRHLGGLEHHQVTPRGRSVDMLIVPHVFAVPAIPLDLEPNHEVAEVVWTPLDPIVRGANHTAEDRVIAGTPTSFNGYRVSGGHFVWGLTYRILHAFFTVLDPRWKSPA